MLFFPSSACKACGEEFVNRTELHNHVREGVNLLRNLAAQPPTPHDKESLSAKQEGADESGNPQWSTLSGRQEVAIDSAQATEAAVVEAGAPSSSSVETSAVQPGSSAGATSLPSEAVQERGMDASLELPLCFTDIGSPVAPEC